MPVIIRPDGEERWSPQSSPGLRLGNKTTQNVDLERRTDMIIRNTARVIREFNLDPETLEKIIETNARNVGLEPDKLRQWAEEHNAWLEEMEQEGIEKE